jgi:LEA14-like dessication related protein
LLDHLAMPVSQVEGRFTSAFATAVLCALLSACSIFTRSIERPTANVREVSVSAASLDGITGELRLDVTNPNGFGVPLAAIDWELSIGGARAVTGSVQLSQTIPARGVAPVVTSLTINPSDAIAVGSSLAGGTRAYRITARLRFSTPLGPLDVGIEHAGELGGGGGGGLLGLLP